MEFGELSDNPFSVNTPPKRPKRTAFYSAVKFLLLIAVCLGATVMLGSYSKTWLAQHLVAEFASLDTATKRTRLTQVAELGIPGIEPLVSALADDEIVVARTAYELLQEVQGRWIELDREEQQRYHRVLVDSIQTIAVHLPDDRTGWGTNLLQQTVAATVNRRDDSSRSLYRSANRTIERLSLSDRAGPSVLSDEPIDSTEPRRLAIRTKALSISAANQSDASIELRADEPVQPLQKQGRSEARIVEGSSSHSRATEPAVHRSGGAVKLQPANAGEQVVLRDIGERQETSYQAKPIVPVAHVVDSPLEALDDESVMKWLGSPHTAMREKANAELLSRGFSQTDISIATQISAGDTATRLTMIDAISRSDQIDPRPWLFMLLSDQNRQVKLRAISVLGTMQDAYVDQRLRMRLTDEQDKAVVAQIRNALEHR
jgi:hypothetical protein